jgi:hypothetical protein
LLGEERPPCRRRDSQKGLLMKAELEKVVLMQEVSWRLKSRATWLKEGDQNMSFSHHLANSHLMNNFCPVLALMEWTLPIKR